MPRQRQKTIKIYSMRLSSEKSSWTKRIVVFLRYMQ